MNTMTFEEVFNSFKTVKFDEKWKNGTGYLNGAVTMGDGPCLYVGEVMSFIDDAGRKGFIIGTPRKNLVIFQRYSNRTDLWVMNSTKAVADLLGPDYSNGFSEELALKLIGYYPGCFSVVEDYNIGKRMNSFLVA